MGLFSCLAPEPEKSPYSIAEISKLKKDLAESESKANRLIGQLNEVTELGAKANSIIDAANVELATLRSIVESHSDEKDVVGLKAEVAKLADQVEELQKELVVKDKEYKEGLKTKEKELSDLEEQKSQLVVIRHTQNVELLQRDETNKNLIRELEEKNSLYETYRQELAIAQEKLVELANNEAGPKTEVFESVVQENKELQDSLSNLNFKLSETREYLSKVEKEFEDYKASTAQEKEVLLVDLQTITTQLDSPKKETQALLDQANERADVANTRAQESTTRADAANARVEELEARLDKADALLGDLKARLDEANSFAEASNKRADGADILVEELMARLVEANSRADKANTLAVEDRTLAEEAREHEEEYKSLAHSADARAEELKAFVVSADAKLENLDAVQELRDALESKTRDLQFLEDECKTLREQNALLADDVRMWQDSDALRRAELKELQEDKISVREALDEVAISRAKLQEARVHEAQLQQNLATARAEVQRLTAVEASQEAELSQTNSKLRLSVEDTRALQDTVSTYEREIQVLKNSVTRGDSAADSGEAMVEGLLAKYAQTQAELQAERDEKQEMNKLLDLLYGQIQELKVAGVAPDEEDERGEEEEIGEEEERGEEGGIVPARDNSRMLELRKELGIEDAARREPTAA